MIFRQRAQSHGGAPFQTVLKFSIIGFINRMTTISARNCGGGTNRPSNRMPMNWRQGLFRSSLGLEVAGVAYMGWQWQTWSNPSELNCWSRIAKWPDGQPFTVFDLFEQANTPANVELNRRKDAWAAESIVTRNQWVSSTRQKLLACETGSTASLEFTGSTNSVGTSLRNSLLGLLLPPLTILIGFWVVRGFRSRRA